MDDLHAQLMDDEKVLWEGHPDKKAFVLTHWFGSGLMFVIVWTLFTAAFVGTMFASGMTLDDMPFPKIIPIGLYGATFLAASHLFLHIKVIII